jgi:hypothetical protein
MKEDIIRMARRAGAHDNGFEVRFVEPRYLERFAALVAVAERNKLAQWMMARGYATGHGDTTEDLLQELEWQIAENWTRGMVNGVQAEREACIDIVARHGGSVEIEAAIRARGNT